MNNLKNKLAALAFATAALGALAFSPASANQNLQLFEKSTGSWQPVNGSYRCLISEDICVAQFKDNQPGGEMVYSEKGRFTQ